MKTEMLFDRLMMRMMIMLMIMMMITGDYFLNGELWLNFFFVCFVFPLGQDKHVLPCFFSVFFPFDTRHTSTDVHDFFFLLIWFDASIWSTFWWKIQVYIRVCGVGGLFEMMFSYWFWDMKWFFVCFIFGFRWTFFCFLVLPFFVCLLTERPKNLMFVFFQSY